MTPTDDEVRRELARLAAHNVLAPQERSLLQTIVQRTIEGDMSRLYQKALADDLGISNPSQIGVLATRIRSKLIEHYGQIADQPIVQILLSEWGYEARFSYHYAVPVVSDALALTVANIRAALEQRTLPGIREALRFVADGLRACPDDPVLLSLQAQCLGTRALYGISPVADLQAAESIVHRLGGASNRPWEFWFVYASVRMALHWDWNGAEQTFGHAIALSNGEARFNAWYTALLASQRRNDEAVEHLRMAVLRAPDSPTARADLAVNQIFAGHYDDAAQTIDTALRLFGPRSHYLLHVHRAILFEARGQTSKAVDAIEAVPLTWPKTAITLGLRALFYGLDGDQRRARWHLSKLRGLRLLTGRKVPAIQLAVAALGTGDHDAAVDWLHKASVSERDPNAVLNNVYPFFRHLYGHPRFRDLITRTMRLPLPD